MLDLDRILDTPPDDAEALGGQRIGSSRRSRPIYGFRFGCGPTRISLIAGCHADEPVGPAMLDRWVTYLAALPAVDRLLTDFSWWIVPHVNPDGDHANRAWIAGLGDAASWTDPSTPVTVDIADYLAHVRREAPGHDLEFGFPRSPADDGARPEARAVATFLSGHGPFALHGSFHGMAAAAGPWFLIERGWTDRTVAMRRRLQAQVRAAGYALHDIDRQGDKGFFRLDEGFTSRPDSAAMRAHFEALDDPATAQLFRPSSMEWVRGLGGDPLTLVSEMPLFLLPREAYEVDDPVRPPAWRRVREAAGQGPEALRRVTEEVGLRPMPLRDQMEFQLRFLAEALVTVQAAADRP